MQQCPFQAKQNKLQENEDEEQIIMDKVSAIQIEEIKENTWKYYNLV